MADLGERVRQALSDLLPSMVADGGGVELVSLNGGVVTVKLVGTCSYCPSRGLSASALRREVQERVPEIAEVTVIYSPFTIVCDQLSVTEGKAEQ